MKNFSIAFTLLTIVISFQACSQNKAVYTPIILDEVYNEWTDITNIANIDGSSNNTIKAINTNDFLFLYFETAEVINIQNNERIVLYIDTDDNSATGHLVNGIGAEIIFNFGTRSGTVYLNENTYSVGTRDLGIVVCPTVWSDKFEISVGRNTQFGGNDLITGNQVKIIIEDKTTTLYSPFESGGATYAFGDYTFNELPSYSITKPNDTLLRFMSHNVEFDAIFEANNKPSFQRMYQAIVPDIIGFQEIYDHTPEEVTALVEEFLPSEDGKQWYGAKINDNILVSRYSIKGAYPANNYGNGAFLVNLRPDYNSDILIINAHTPCCDNDARRQDEIDAMMAFIRDAKSGTGDLSLDEKTPILLMGDMNLVGDPQNLATLLTGNIVDETTWGSDFTPDWNGDNFIDVKPLATNLPMTFTHWDRSGEGNYSKGRLDIIIYSGSGMTLENSFVMYTNSLPQDSLTHYSLQETDSEDASDHLPLIADFTITAEQEVETTLLDLQYNNSEEIFLYPNPTSGILHLKSINKNAQSIHIIDIAGKTIFEKVNLQQFETIDISSCENGIYMIVIQTETERFHSKIRKE